MQVTGEARGHVLPAPARGGTRSHEAHVLNALPEQLAAVIHPSLVLHHIQSGVCGQCDQGLYVDSSATDSKLHSWKAE